MLVNICTAFQLEVCMKFKQNKGSLLSNIQGEGRKEEEMS